MNSSRIYPNYTPINLKEATPGDLVLVAFSRNALKPCFIYSASTNTPSKNECLVLSPEWNILALEKIQPVLALKLSNDWRFRLEPVIPDRFSGSPWKIEPEQISICEKGRFFAAREHNFVHENPFLIDIDFACTREPGYVAHAAAYHYSKFKIEFRSNNSEPWEELAFPIVNEES